MKSTTMEVKCPNCLHLVEIPTKDGNGSKLLVIEPVDCPICAAEFDMEYVRWMDGQDN